MTCNHSFPDPFPQPISQIGGCRNCGISYQEAKAEMSAADELRAASARLRELAGRATEAPWSTAWNGQQYELRGPDEAAYPIAEWTYAINTTEPKVSEERAECNTADADWIAAMHPGVGHALADWLDSAAANAAVLTWPNDFIERALAVARQINTGSQA